jgi:hypothetical protein
LFLLNSAGLSDCLWATALTTFTTVSSIAASSA